MDLRMTDKKNSSTEEVRILLSINVGGRKTLKSGSGEDFSALSRLLTYLQEVDN